MRGRIVVILWPFLSLGPFFLCCLFFFAGPAQLQAEQIPGDSPTMPGRSPVGSFDVMPASALASGGSSEAMPARFLATGGGSNAIAGSSVAAMPTARSTPPDQPPVHFQHEGILSPGQIAAARLSRGGPVLGYFQPVEIKAPLGVSVALAEGAQFGPLQPAPVRVGLLIGPVYRLRVTNIPRHPGEEVYPTIEVIDRLYAPMGQEARFAIPIQLHQEDLELALEGKLVTRVIYVEDPQRALPVAAEAINGENWFEVGPGRDPLAVADQLGRPVAIVRLGGRVPLDPEHPEPEFMGPPAPYERLPARMRVLQPPPRKPAAAKEAGR